jgi:hypothetical protein
MSKLSLRAAFTLGLRSTLAAQQVFTDRVTEIAAFDTSLESLQRSLSVAELSPVIDRSAPRANVLVYFGVGGIGKTGGGVRGDIPGTRYSRLPHGAGRPRRS